VLKNWHNKRHDIAHAKALSFIPSFEFLQRYEFPSCWYEENKGWLGRITQKDKKFYTTLKCSFDRVRNTLSNEPTANLGICSGIRIDLDKNTSVTYSGSHWISVTVQNSTTCATTCGPLYVITCGPLSTPLYY
jgi:hypothetical protein